MDQDEWAQPRPGPWLERLAAAIGPAGSTPCVLVAHSLGCHLAALWASRAAPPGGPVEGALLVAPPDLDAPERAPAETAPFAPVVRRPLGIPATVVASCDDPYSDQGRARELASEWGARFVDAGRSGHLNLESGHGPWPQGERLLEDLG